MTRTIILVGREVTYTLTRKKVKNLNLRIKADGSVAVSASPRVPLETVERFLREHEAYIVKTLDRFAKTAQSAPRHVVDGERVMCLGRACTLRVIAGSKNAAQLDGDVLTLTVKNIGDEAARNAVLETWKKRTIDETATPLVRTVHTHVAPYGVPFPAVSFRRMKTRWGSCCPAKNKITLSTALAEKSIDEIEYVVYHELTHFLHADHSAAFYEALTRFLPDWKARRDRLNGR